jgi:hypothetical protein
MVRFAYGAKATVESCRHIDVLYWNRLGYFRSPRLFSWAWSVDGEQVASIVVQTARPLVILKYKFSSHGEEWSEVEQRVPIHVDLAVTALGLSVQYVQMGDTADDE